MAFLFEYCIEHKPGNITVTLAMADLNLHSIIQYRKQQQQKFYDRNIKVFFWDDWFIIMKLP